MDRLGVGVLLMCVLAASANSIGDKIDIEGTETNITETSDITDTVITENPGIVNITEGQSPVRTQLENKLYNHIIARNFKEAVENTLSFYASGWGEVIRTVVNRLIDESNHIVFDYTCKISEARATFISRTYFPYALRVHEKLMFARIIDNRYGWALRYGNNVDWEGDKKVLGDRNTKKIFETMWWFVPYWFGNRLYFKLRTLKEARWLKLGNTRDYDGDHEAFGDNDQGTSRHVWYFKPVRHNGKLLFYIINKEYDELLKFGQSTKYDGYRIGYGNSTMDLNPDKFAWEFNME